MSHLPIIAEQHQDSVRRGADCTRCAFYDSHRGPVPSIINPGTRIAFVGEGPGPDEVEAHTPFVGFSGKILNKSIRAGGMERTDCSILNATSCAPPEKESLDDFETRWTRKAKRAAKDVEQPEDYTLSLPTVACRGRLDHDLDLAIPLVYVAIGKEALASVERYLRDRFMYDGDTLVMAQMHGAPVVLSTPREAYERTHAALAKYAQPSLTDAPHVRKLHAIAHLHSMAAHFHGADSTRFLFGSYHPAFAAPNRSPKWMSTVIMNLQRATSVAMRGWIDWREPKYLTDPTVQQAVEWLDNAVRKGHRLRVTDLETCRKELPPDPVAGKPSKDQHECAIRTIGVAYRDESISDPVDGWHVLVVPFRHMDGSHWWDDRDRARLGNAFARFFNAPGMIVTHNGVPFDSAIMLRPMTDTLGVPFYLGGNKPLLDDPKRIIIDTRIIHHNTPMQDMPHSLSFVTRQLFEAYLWKSKEDITSTDNANDDRLKLRCAVDTYTTGQIVGPLYTQCQHFEMSAQNDVDHRVGLILRDMSELGICMDEHERGFLSEVLNRECERLRAKWTELVGKDVNPRSVHQMQALLYEDWGIEPPLSTDNDVYDPEKDDDPFDPDEGATSAEALIMIQDRAIEHGIFGNAETKEQAKRRLEAIETLLEYKALDKPRGAYADNVPVRPWPGEMDRGRAPARGALLERPGRSWVRATWVIPVTPVGRSACRSPGLQQVPQLGRWIILPDGSKYRVNMRKPYIAAPGHVFVAADYAQSHVRIFYAVAQDEVGYDAIKKKLKPHHLHAAALIADHPSKIMEVYQRLLKMNAEDQEYWKLVAKKFVFATIYNPRVIHVGSNIQAYHTNYRVMKKERDKSTGKRSFPNLKVDDCRVWEDRWYEGHPCTEPWQVNELRKYEKYGYAESVILDKRRRYGPLEPTMIGNHAILAFEGSLKNKAMMEIADRIPHRGWSEWSGLVGDFHDSLMVQVPKERAKEAAQIIKEAMTLVWRDMTFTADPKEGESWGEMG